MSRPCPCKRINFQTMNKIFLIALLNSISIITFSQVDSANIQEKYLPFGSFIERMPYFKGGEEALSRFRYTHAIYTAKALEAGIEGTVYISFYVEKDGKITRLKLLRGLQHDLDSIALRAISDMPDWIPGSTNGKPIAVNFNLPVRFRLNGRTPGNKPEPSTYWSNKGKKLFYKECLDKQMLQQECDCWFSFIVWNYNDLRLAQIDLDEMIKMYRCDFK